MGDLTVYVSSVQRTQYVSRQYTRDGFLDGSGNYGPARCVVTLAFEGPRPDDGFRVTNLIPVGEIFDDRGEPVGVSSAQIVDPGAATTMTASVMLADVHPKARGLRALEGELSLYGRAQRVQVAVPWPKGNEQPKAASAGIVVTLEEARKDALGLTLKVRVDHPEGTPMSWNFTPRGGPIALLDAEGKPFAGGRLNFMGGSSGNMYRVYHLQYPGATEVPARVAAIILLRSGGLTTVPFRLERIPLPEYGQSGGEGTNAPDPFLDSKSAAALVSRVVVAGKPGGPGTLVLGLRLAEKQKEPANPGSYYPSSPAGWRWYELPTDAEGGARLERLRPGKYLIRRYWRPAAGALPDPLRWNEALVEIAVGEQGATTLPPLAAPRS